METSTLKKRISVYAMPGITEITPVSAIIKAASSVYGISPEQLVSKTRKRQIVEARQIAMYFARNNTALTVAEIGKKIGNKDHATVLHAMRTVDVLRQTDKHFAEKFNDVKSKLNE